MSTSTKPINQLHAENIDWQSRLEFYTDEVKIMTERIAEVARKNTAKDIQAHVEHFQNQMILQKELIDQLNHDIRDHEEYILKNIEKNPTAVDHRQLNDHPMLRDRMSSFETIFNALRKELDLFLAQVM